MPIRFRCAYCNQLLGIARRKAGTVVRCPTCSGQVIVPAEQPEEGRPALPHAPLGHGEAPEDESLGVERIDSAEAAHYPAGFPAPARFIVLSPARAALLALLIVALVAAALAIGYWLGGRPPKNPATMRYPVTGVEVVTCPSVQTRLGDP